MFEWRNVDVKFFLCCTKGKSWTRKKGERRNRVWGKFYIELFDRILVHVPTKVIIHPRRRANNKSILQQQSVDIV